MIDTKNLEKLLIKNWTEFLDPRQTMTYLLSIASKFVDIHTSSDIKVKKLTVTRFELTENGFIVWFDYILTQYDKEVNVVSELLLTASGFTHIQSIKN